MVRVRGLEVYREALATGSKRDELEFVRGEKSAMKTGNQKQEVKAHGDGKKYDFVFARTDAYVIVWGIFMVGPACCYPRR